MSNEDEYDEYSDEDDGDDIHAECLNCGTLNRFPGKDIPKILCYECGEIIEAQPEPPPPAPSPVSAAGYSGSGGGGGGSGGGGSGINQAARAPVTATNSSAPPPTTTKSAPLPQSPPQKEKEKEKKKGLFRRGSKKSASKIKTSNFQGDGNPSITAPVFVKHVSGATQGDDISVSEKGLIVGNRPDPSLPVDVEKKSRAMDIPIGVEQKPLTGGLSSVTAPTNVRKNPDPLSSIQQGGKPKQLSKEEKRAQREKEKMVRKAKKVAEKEAKKFAKSGVVLEKRKFPVASPSPSPSPSPNSSSTHASQPSVTIVAPTPSPNPTPAAANKAAAAPSPVPNEPEEFDEDEVSEFCSKCGSLNVFPPGANCVACYECDTPIYAPANAKAAGGGGGQESFDEGDDDDDEITDVCPNCNTLNAFPSEDVPQIACYNCGSAIDNPRGGGADGAEEGELQSFCGSCGSLNIFPPGVFAVACWECESPIFYKT